MKYDWSLFIISALISLMGLLTRQYFFLILLLPSGIFNWKNKSSKD